MAGQGLRLHLDYSGSHARRKTTSSSGSLDYAQKDAWAAAYSTVAAGAALVAGLGVLAYLRRSGNWFFQGKNGKRKKQKKKAYGSNMPEAEELIYVSFKAKIQIGSRIWTCLKTRSCAQNPFL